MLSVPLVIVPGAVGNVSQHGQRGAETFFLAGDPLSLLKGISAGKIHQPGIVTPLGYPQLGSAAKFLLHQLGEQLRGEELTVLYEDGDILFRSNRVRSTDSVDELRNAIEDFGHEIDIEHFGVGLHGFDLDEEFDELDVADALASEMDAALKEIVEHE